MSETMVESDEPSSSSDENADFLYDVLLCYHWDKQSDNGCQSEEMESNSFLSSLFKSQPQSLSSARRPTWQLSCSAKGEHVAVAESAHLNIWQQSQVVVSARVAIPFDPKPRLRRLLWSPDNELLVLTSSRGRVFVFDKAGQPLYALLSQHIEQNNEDGGGDGNKAYVDARFKNAYKSNRWNGELVLTTYGGSLLCFRLSLDGYQEAFHAQLPLEGNTLLSATCLVHSNLWITSSSCAKTELQCWRRTEDEPFVAAVEVVGGRLEPRLNKSTSSWSLFPRRYNDPAVDLEATKEEHMLLSSHQSGTLAIWKLPSLTLLKTVVLEEQPCFDDLSPNLLLKPHLKKPSNDPSQFVATQVRWWDESKTQIVVARGTGALTLLQIKLEQDYSESDEDVVNVLGESAEFFAPGVVLSAKADDGIFVLENETSTEEENDDDSQKDEEKDHEEERGWMRYFSPFGNRQTALEHESVLFNERRLYYLRSTSPSELFSRKIDDEEYGEAILLAHHYNLDTDAVYIEQWKRSRKDANAIQDYLSKMSDTSAVIIQCLTIVPETIEDNEALLRFGQRKIDSIGVHSTIKLDQCRRILQQFSSRLETYSAILDERRRSKVDTELCSFDIQFYQDFRSKPLVKSVHTLAEMGDIVALEVCLDMHWSELQSHYLSILNHIPESLSVESYKHLMPPAYYKCELSREEMSEWFEQRARAIVDSCDISENALKLIEIADEYYINIEKRLRFLLGVLNTLQVGMDGDDMKENRTPKVWSLTSVLQSDHLTLLRAFFEGIASESLIKQRFSRLALPYFEHLRLLNSIDDQECLNALETMIADIFFPVSLKHTLLIINLLDHSQNECLESLMVNNASFVAKLVLDLLMKCDKNAEIASLARLLEFAKKLLRKAETEDLKPEIKELTQSLETLENLRQREIPVSLGMLQRARSDEGASKAIVNQFVDNVIVKSNKKSILLESTLNDLLPLVQSSFHLDASKAFYITLNKLLTSEDHSLVKSTLATLSGFTTSKSTRSELQSLLVSYSIDVSQSSIGPLLASASLHYVHVATDLRDTLKLSMAQQCISLFRKEPEVISMQYLLDAIEAARKLDDVDLEPAMLATIKNSKELVLLVDRIINTCSKEKGDWCKVIFDLVNKLALRLDIEEKSYLGTILVRITKKALSLNLRQQALDLCLLIVEKHIPFGYSCCLETLQKFRVEGDKRRRLIDFCCTYCQPDQLSECLKIQRETAMTKYHNSSDFTRDMPLQILRNVIKRPRFSIKEDSKSLDIVNVFSEALLKLPSEKVLLAPKQIISEVLNSEEEQLHALKSKLESLLQDREEEESLEDNEEQEDEGHLDKKEDKAQEEQQKSLENESEEDLGLEEEEKEEILHYKENPESSERELSETEGWDIDEVEIDNEAETPLPTDPTTSAAAKEFIAAKTATESSGTETNNETLMSVPEALRNAFSKLHSKLK